MGSIYNTDASEYLRNFVHNKLKASLNLQNVKKDENNAKKIERFLREVKQIDAKANTIKDSFSQEEISLDGTAYNLMRESLEKNFKKLKLSSLFQRSYGVKALNTIHGGDTFEKEFSIVLQSLYESALNENSLREIEKELSLKGQTIATATNIGAETANILENTVSKQIAEEINKINQSFNKKIKKLPADAGYTVEARFGKIDNQGLGGYTDATLEFKEQLNNNFTEVLSIMHNSTFSLKSYSDYVNNSNIGLGKTDLYKSLSGSLSQLGISSKSYRDKIIYKSLASYNKNDNANEISKHLSHLQLYYELTGVGLTYKNEILFANNMVDFLVYNVPDSKTEIYVRSTKKIIYDLLFSDKYNFTQNNLVEKYTISKSYFR